MTMLGLFATTLFTNACLLFLIQPMISRMILPLLGGAPAVWTTCMLFFQMLLLAGYLYSHWITTRFSFRRQLLVHGLVLLLPLAMLPIAVRGAGAPAAAPPVVWVLCALALSVSLPFFAVATSSPLLQKWFTRTGHARSRDPYFLYAASNLGNLAGLVGYPLAMEPLLRLGAQSWAWTAAYLALVALTATCAAMAVKSAGGSESAAEAPLAPVERLPWRRRLHWVTLAFAPSSLLLGVTTYLTTDIAAIPLLWLIPLGLYLGTFVIAFGRLPEKAREGLNTFGLPAGLVLFFILCIPPAFPPWVMYAFHLATFFALSLVCHAELARQRPDPRHLTEFFLWIAAGGVLGGLFNAVVAPVVFSSVLEYPLSVLVACLLVPPPESLSERASLGRNDVVAASGVAALALALVHGHEPMQTFLAPAGDRLVASAEAGHAAAAAWAPTLLVLVAVPLLLCWLLDARPARFRVSVGLLALLTSLNAFAAHRPLHQERGFFGVISVIEQPQEALRELRHGTTVHGKQSTDPERRGEPLTYYHPESPIGQVMRVVQMTKREPRIAVIGLGAGTLAAYGRKGQRLTFYEIDPVIARIARDPAYFTYLSDAEKRGVAIDVVMGDARLELRGAPDRRYDLIVVDAFSSDAIPVHLLTAEALALYREKLADDGIIAFHVSNQYLDLEPVIGNLARDASLVALDGLDDPDEDAATGWYASEWIAVSRRNEALRAIAALGDWEPAATSSARVWRDDFSNLLGALKWLPHDEDEAD